MSSSEAERISVDWRDPEYGPVYHARSLLLADLRKDPKTRNILAGYYRIAPWDFVRDWGMTFDPRLIEQGRQPIVPFVLWDRQREFLEWMYQRWQSGERGLVEKTRDCGATWLALSFAVCYWLFQPGFTAGFGSRTEEKVDRKGDMQSIFERIRFFLSYIPEQLMPPNYKESEHSSERKLVNPDNGASLVGEAGPNIGRAGRYSIFFVDEAAFVEHQMSADSALSVATNCQLDISSFNGSGNPFFEKQQRVKGSPKHFIFDWRDDPRKDQAWHDRQVDALDPIIVAQEIDRDPFASNVDSFIPSAWVQSAVDAHIHLGFRASGIRVTAFDPADVGDAKACVNRHGSVITEAIQMEHGEIGDAIPWAAQLADDFRADVLTYDGDGMGAPTMKTAFTDEGAYRMRLHAYHGSAGVEDPEQYYDKSEGTRQAPQSRDERVRDLHSQDKQRLRTNGDMFLNYRAQSWTWARDRFEKTHTAMERRKKGLLVNVDPEYLISIDSRCKNLTQLLSELPLPRRRPTPNGKRKVESKDDARARGVKSWNLADALIMSLVPVKPKVVKAKTPYVASYGQAVPGVM